MSAKGILYDLIAAHWEGLTTEQQVCWRFWAADNPRTDREGRLGTRTGWQAFYSANCITALHPTPAWIDEPPAVEPEQPTVKITVGAWGRTARLANNTTARSGFAWLEIDEPLPDNTYASVTQSYYRQVKNPTKASRIRHTNILGPGDSGTVNLQTPSGYYAETAGVNKFAKIKGITARRRRDRPLGTLRITTNTGTLTWRSSLPNPLVGTSTGVYRLRNYP